MVLKRKNRYKRLPKHKRPYPYNKSAYWQMKNNIRHRYHMCRYWLRDQIDEIKDIINELKNK